MRFPIENLLNKKSYLYTVDRPLIRPLYSLSPFVSGVFLVSSTLSFPVSTAFA